MARVHAIRIEPLTAEAFAPFGTVIDAGTRAPDYVAASGTEQWHASFESGRPLLSLLRTPFQGLRFRAMERHFHVTQAFIPLGGQHAAVAVAPPSADRDALPEVDAIRAFLLDGSKGYVLHRGTWHSLDRFPLRPSDTRFVMITDHETQSDLTAAYAAGEPAALTQEVDLERALGVTIELVA
jgi:ureidoglycolate hydrolase